jgi:subtilisin family serine protease
MAQGLVTAIPELDDCDRQTDGEKTTQRTLSTLREREDQYVGAVGTAILYFRHGFTDDEVELLSHATHSQPDRQTRRFIAETRARRVQEQVRSLLADRDAIQSSFFARNRFFQFEPDLHVRSLPVTNALIVLANSSLVERLWKFDEVIAIDLDSRALRPIRAQVIPLSSPMSVSFVEGGGTAKYTWGWARLGLERLHQLGYTGQGRTIGIVDSGVCERHGDLRGKVSRFMKVERQGEPQQAYALDDAWHGTFCGGILVGNSASKTQIGGAPDAQLKVASILNRKGGLMTDLFTALEWFTQSENSVDVLNFSLAISDNVPKASRRRLRRKLRVFSTYMLLVAAIGNDPESSAYPGRFDFVISAGAIDENDTVSKESGHCPDLVLPGVKIYSCVPTGRKKFFGNSHALDSGTSMAAAHLSALAALVKQAFPDASPSAVADALKQSADRWGNYDQRYGYGVPDALAAIERLNDMLSGNGR